MSLGPVAGLLQLHGAETHLEAAEAILKLGREMLVSRLPCQDIPAAGLV